MSELLTLIAAVLYARPVIAPRLSLPEMHIPPGGVPSSSSAASSPEYSRSRILT